MCLRYTALDYALMGEHYEVCQYMMEQGALSITSIQDISARKIQVSLPTRWLILFSVEAMMMMFYKKYCGHGGSVVGSGPCVRKVAGSNPTLAAT